VGHFSTGKKKMMGVFLKQKEKQVVGSHGVRFSIVAFPCSCADVGSQDKIFQRGLQWRGDGIESYSEIHMHATDLRAGLQPRVEHRVLHYGSVNSG